MQRLHFRPPDNNHVSGDHFKDYYIVNNKVSSATSRVLMWCFFIVAIGWEIWLTYGLAGGLPVDERRSVALSCAIPQNFNWLLNSLADILIIWIGLFLVKSFYTQTLHLNFCADLYTDIMCVQ